MILKQHAARGIVRIYNDMKKHAHLRKMIKEVDNEMEIDASDLDHSNAAAYESLPNDDQESQK